MGRILIGAAVLVVAVGVVVVLGRDLQVVQGSLTDTRSALLAARASLADGDVDATTQALERARRSVGTANARVNRLLWQVAEVVPIAGRSMRSISATVAIADETARLGGQVAEGARVLVGEDGSVAVQVEDGRIPVGPLGDAAAVMAEVHTDELRRLLDELDDVPATWVPPPVATARLEVATLGREVVQVIDGVRELLGALPQMLGEDGPRRYFLAMQNPAELRGTGGLVGFFATVEVANGRMQLSRPESYEALDSDPTVEASAAASASDTFLARYGPAEAASFFGNVNVDPDLPTTAPVMMDLYEARSGLSVDGVIAIDPVGLALLLEATGPVDVPDDVAATAPGLPDPIDPAAVPGVTMVDLYDAFVGRNEARRTYLREMATTAFDAIFDAQWDGVAMSRQVGDAITRGHLSFHLRDRDVQSALVSLDAAGAVAPPEADRDHFAVTANNLAGNKLDHHMGHLVSGTIRLSGDGRTAVHRELDLRVEVVNEFDPAGRAPYIAGSFPVAEFEAPPAERERGPVGLNRTWFSTWVPGKATMAVDESPATTWFLHGHTVADHTIDIPTGETVGFDVSGSGPAPVTTTGTDRRYVLEYRRQAKSIPDRLDLTIEPPPGWEVVATEVLGGGEGAGGGPFGDPGPQPSATVSNGNVIVAGDASADVVIVVDLRPASSTAAPGGRP